MALKKQKRDNSYYLNRLQAEHPSVWTDYQAGKFKNASEAFRAAGMKKSKTALEALRSAWAQASGSERSVFKAEIGCVSLPPPPMSVASVPPLSTSVPVPSGSKVPLPPALATEIESVMARRGLKIGAIMRELGRPTSDTSLGMALHRGTLIQRDLIIDLEAWVLRQVNTLGL